MKMQGILSPRAAFALSVAVGLALLAASPAWAAGARSPALSGELSIGGTGAALGTMQKLADQFRKSHPEVRVTVLPSLGSGGGIKALAAGKLSLSVSSRPITDAERATGVQAREIARTPLVFATSPKTPVSDVSLDELAALYSGKTTHWSDGTLVRPVLRPTDDIDTRLVRGMSPALDQATEAAHRREGKNIAITDTESADELERIPGAIGTSTLSLIRSEERRLKILSVGGLVPSIGDRANGKYPYQKSIYLIFPANPSPVARAFVEFMDSAAAATILAQTGNLVAGSAK